MHGKHGVCDDFFVNARNLEKLLHVTNDRLIGERWFEVVPNGVSVLDGILFVLQTTNKRQHARARACVCHVTSLAHGPG